MNLFIATGHDYSGEDEVGVEIIGIFSTAELAASVDWYLANPQWREAVAPIPTILDKEMPL